ncbi:hypothetical protein PUNSTDRAFT_32382, partial [Punctularia strigosozonata HHB-11173 SS5]|uniref:uncharacterized protein n=1 Tax=Punctularia strigosozonata (strain HHB-11173) TaxID=741275 RepID=UPI00044186F4
MWASADQNQLNYLLTHQSQLHAHLYSGLADAIANGFDTNLHKLGRLVTLPSSYTNGPWYMQQICQDALAIRRYLKKVDLFITMTVNPQWEEITHKLLPGQSPADRPDLITWVFQLKKKVLLKRIFHDGILCETIGQVWMIEFQKCGLPHMHLLVFLAPHSWLLTPEHVD